MAGYDVSIVRLMVTVYIALRNHDVYFNGNPISQALITSYSFIV